MLPNTLPTAIRTPVVPGEAVTADSVNRQLNLINGIDDQVALFGNSQYIDSASTTINLIANQEVYVRSTSATSTTLNFPPAANCRKPIVVEQAHSELKELNAVANGSDTINTFWNKQPVPTDTNFKLLLPGEHYTFVPKATYWEMVNGYCPKPVFKARTLFPQDGLSNVDTKIYYEQELFDQFKNFNAGSTGATSRFTAPFDGLYYFYQWLRINDPADAGSTSVINLQFLVNGVTLENVVSNYTNGSNLTSGKTNGTIELSAGDYVEAWWRTPGANIAINTSLGLNGFEGQLITRTSNA